MAKPPVVDIHAHFYPESYMQVLAQHGYSPGTIYSDAAPADASSKSAHTYKRPDPAFTDIAQRIAAMDSQGVTVQALSIPSPWIFWKDDTLAVKLAHAYNDAASAAHIAHPNRLVGLITLPMHDANLALTELDRASRLPGMRGVALGTHAAGRELSDRMFFPLYERISALGLPIFLHYAPLMVIGGNDRLKQFQLGNLIGNAVETAIAAAHLIFGGVFDTFPALEVCLPHAGGVLPILIGRWDQGYRVRNECKHVPHSPSYYLRRFTYDTVSHSDLIMEYLVKLVGADRIMLGSDYCFDMGYERPVEMVERLAVITDREREQILGATAARLLALG
jgi:aminocarboxymuconate-semialdehyde decarboxylase